MSFTKLLIPIDFSPASKNAVNYGIQLAHLLHVENIVLLHVYSANNAIANQPIISAALPAMLQENQDELERIKQRVESDNSTKVETLLLEGKITSLSHDLIKEKGVDLIVMGITEKTKLEQTVIGSNAINVMRKTTCPVIIVPEKSDWNLFKNIVVAIDITQDPKSVPHDTIKSFFIQAHSEKLHLLNIEENEEHNDHIQNPNIEKLNFEFQDLDSRIEVLSNTSKLKAIDNYCHQKEASLLILIERKYDIWDTIFHKSLTRQLAFESNIPILVLESDKV